MGKVIRVVLRAWRRRASWRIEVSQVGSLTLMLSETCKHYVRRVHHIIRNRGQWVAVQATVL